LRVDRGGLRIKTYQGNDLEPVAPLRYSKIVCSLRRGKSRLMGEPGAALLLPS
jgi:hypothetical protein